MRIQGVPCHDAATHSNVGLSSARVDAVLHRILKYKLETLDFVKKIEYGDGYDTITNPEVVGVALEEQDIIVDP